MRVILSGLTASWVLLILSNPSVVVGADTEVGSAVVGRGTANQNGDGTLCIAAKPGENSEDVADALAHKLEVSGGAQLDTVEIQHGVATAKYSGAAKGAKVEGSVRRDVQTRYGLGDCNEALAAAPPPAAGIGAASIMGGVVMVGTGLGLGIAAAEGVFGTTTFPGKPPSPVPPGPPSGIPPGPPSGIPPGPPSGVPPGPPPPIPQPPVTASQ